MQKGRTKAWRNQTKTQEGELAKLIRRKSICIPKIVTPNKVWDCIPPYEITQALKIYLKSFVQHHLELNLPNFLIFRLILSTKYKLSETHRQIYLLLVQIQLFMPSDLSQTFNITQKSFERIQ